MKKIIVVAGPTASGKTALAVRLARSYDGEVISADSMQIYKGIDILSAKPTRDDMRGIAHHLIDILDPSERFSVADFCSLADGAAADICARGKLPVLAGGTGLYIDSFVDSIRFSEIAQDEALRRALTLRAEQEGGEALLRELSVFDPESAAQIHANNLKRIIRAIEVYRITGKTMSEHREASKAEQRYRPVYFVLCFANRQTLYERIDRRVEQMVEQGLEAEARRLYERRLPPDATANQAIGYKEFFDYFEGRLSFDDALALIKRRTRNYAKRQETWFKRSKNAYFLYADGEDVFRQAAQVMDAQREGD